MEKNPTKINWMSLSTNHNAIHLLERELHKIDWLLLSMNPNAISLLKANQDKINPDIIFWTAIYANPSIFKLDTDAMRNQCQPFAEELTARVFHPLRMQRLCYNYNVDFEELVELY